MALTLSSWMKRRTSDIEGSASDFRHEPKKTIRSFTALAKAHVDSHDDRAAHFTNSPYAVEQFNGPLYAAGQINSRQDAKGEDALWDGHSERVPIRHSEGICFEVATSRFLRNDVMAVNLRSIKRLRFRIIFKAASTAQGLKILSELLDRVTSVTEQIYYYCRRMIGCL